MKTLEATIHCVDERLQVLLSPALESMVSGPLQEAGEPRQITLISLVDDRTLEPALFYNPYFVLPTATHSDQYIHFLQALRHTDQFALVDISGSPQQPAGLLYPYKNYLMLVLIRSDAELVEPAAPDWAVEAAALTAEDVAHLRSKLESLNQTDLQARKAQTGI